jgi:peptide/nickel transport system permease protein
VARFISTRLLQMIVVIAIMSFIVYSLIGLMPGDPIDLMISSNPRLSPAGRRAAAEGAVRPR